MPPTADPEIEVCNSGAAWSCVFRRIWVPDGGAV